MRLTRTIVLLSFLIGELFHAPLIGQIQVSGFVKESNTNEALVGASVYSPESLVGTSSDNNGYFNIILAENEDSISFSYVGFETFSLGANFSDDTILTVFLDRSATLEEVKIVRKQNRGINISTLSRQEFITIPSLGAEADIMKTLQLLPGIQSQNEGSSNLLVRGGGPGQNLFLLDNIPLFYVNHVGGFVSVFNPEIINDVAVYKGGFPAKFGGKLSSVIDITLREGNRSGFKGSAGIGFTGANLSFEGPIGEKATYAISGRKTFTELLMGAASLIADQDYLVSYGFYDLNGKITWNPDLRNQFQFAVYTGDDQMMAFQYVKSNEYFKLQNKWGNILSSIKWKHIYSPKLFITNSFSVTRYRIRDFWKAETIPADSAESHYQRTTISTVRDISFKSDWKYRIARAYAIDFGIQASSLTFIPNKTWETNEERRIDANRINAFESALYLENQVKIKQFLELNLGFRGVAYLIDHYSAFQIEPRMDLAVNLSNDQFLQLTYMRANQNAHMIFASGGFVNNEVWLPSIESVPPAKVTQYTGGWKGSFYKNLYEAEINLYLKKMTDLLAFKDGYSHIIGDAHWLSKIETGGVGESKGVEVFLRKTRGKWSGFLSYVYSRTSRQFENINLGAEYVYEYDRPHSIALDLNYQLSNRFVFNAAWVFQSGLPYTPALGLLLVPEKHSLEETYSYQALLYGERNSARMRDYHRLDVAVNYETTTKRGRDATWTFSIYNAYNRHNAYYYFYNTKPRLTISKYGFDRQSTLKQYQFSFFPIIPSLSYKVFF